MFCILFLLHSCCCFSAVRFVIEFIAWATFFMALGGVISVLFMVNSLDD